MRTKQEEQVAMIEERHGSSETKRSVSWPH